MRHTLLLKLIRFWPPFLGAGIKVKECSADFTYIVVQMNMSFWNKNYVGTHFGGSIYSMTDPFYMLMLMHILGKEYIVWDKSASIRYKMPAKGTIFATFSLSLDYIEQLRQDINNNEKLCPEFLIEITNEAGEVVAEVQKTLFIKKKDHRK